MMKKIQLLGLAGASVLFAQSPASAQDTIKIGELNSYKTVPAFLEPYKKGWELAIEEINASGGVLGRPIEAVHFTPPSYAQPRPPAILFGAIHGDEAVTQMMLERLADELIERPPGRDTWIVPVVNVDGLLAGTRNNANDVDLNRNFASTRWGTERRPGYNPGNDCMYVVGGYNTGFVDSAQDTPWQFCPGSGWTVRWTPVLVTGSVVSSGVPGLTMAVM